MTCDKKDLLLYAVTDRSWLKGASLSEAVEKALLGGATFVQLREKTLPKDAVIKEAVLLKALCREYGVPFVIDDDVDVAKRVGADGVHVGQKDMALKNARALLGADAIIGVSAQNVAQAVRAERDGADYLGVGAVFSTQTKRDAEAVPYETLRAICESVSIPVIAIGGITKDNVRRLKDSGICGVAVISALFAAEDITKAARELKEETETCVSGDRNI